MTPLSRHMQVVLASLKCCVLRDRTRHDVATVRQDDLADLLDLVAALIAANESQAAVIDKLTRPVPRVTPAIVEPRLCTRDCAVTK